MAYSEALFLALVAGMLAAAHRKVWWAACLLGLGAALGTASLFNDQQLQQARGKLAIAVKRPDGLQGVSVTPEVLSGVAEPLFLVTGADKHAIVDEFVKSDSHTVARRAIAGCPKAEIWIAA